MIHEHPSSEDRADHHSHEGHEAAKSETKDDAIKRLSYIEGHLAGVKKMVDEDRYCVDILRQTFAVRRALQKLESQLIDGHLRTCVVDGVKDGREEQVLSELVELYEIADR
jgi:CsoR family transcriptional regulator, copper-sensing transcriptional repressor